jgi:hypothetical protein
MVMRIRQSNWYDVTAKYLSVLDVGIALKSEEDNDPGKQHKLQHISFLGK